MADLCTALAYYDDHRDDFAEQEQEYATARVEGERQRHAQLANEAASTKQAE